MNLRLSKELNALISSAGSIEEVQREARLIAETTVFPELVELRQSIADPARPWHRRFFDLAKETPELVGNFVTMPKALATAKVLAKLAEVLGGEAIHEHEKNQKIRRSGFHYLLSIEAAMNKSS